MTMLMLAVETRRPLTVFCGEELLMTTTENSVKKRSSLTVTAKLRFKSPAVEMNIINQQLDSL